MTWQYIAGFFDGEGSIVHNGKGYRFTIAQTNFRVLSAINKFVGVGNVIKVSKRKVHWKDSWVYYVSRQEDVLFVIRNVKPFLIVKKKKVEQVLPDLIRMVVKQQDVILKRNLLIKSAKSLREGGMSYREIGRRLNIDFGQARRLIKK